MPCRHFGQNRYMCVSTLYVHLLRFSIFYLSPLYQNGTLSSISLTFISPMFLSACKVMSSPSIIVGPLGRKYPNFLLLSIKWFCSRFKWQIPNLSWFSGLSLLMIILLRFLAGFIVYIIMAVIALACLIGPLVLW